MHSFVYGSVKNIDETFNKIWDIAVIGSGMGSLTAASLHAKDGKNIVVLEQNYLPGGCVSSYYRKGYIFEAGATTLVGMDDNMPLKYLLEELNISIDKVLLKTPMKVHFQDKTVATRHHSIDEWIEEAERIFGKKNQRLFWEYCFKVSNFVWETSLKQLSFPPTRFKDLIPILKKFQFKQVQFATTAFTSMQLLLEKYDLLDNERFINFINEQLLITAQNSIEEVNVLFGCTALCYTNFGNYYVNGGLINLVKPICEYINSQNGTVLTRVGVNSVELINGFYELKTNKKGEGKVIRAKRLISGIPINNTLDLYSTKELNQKYKKSLMPSEKLVSAFGMGIGFKSDKKFDCIHHQIHLDEPLPYCNSKSIFVSLNHASDQSRTPSAAHRVANISTHVHDLKTNDEFDKEVVENAIFDALEKHDFLKKEEIEYYHSYLPTSWENWIGRKYGFVGGYPQYLKIKPWQMIDARLDGKNAYICGDTTYPGQGIPGATLSGLIAYQKMKLDGV
ncbi:MAG: phytoene desaturase family protein [Saprospiraceae bacterium]